MRSKLLTLVLSYLTLLPAAAWAQTNGAIAGVVKDASGAVLPGVVVEAASPALIERVRDVVTDGQGLYTISDLRPGVYSVTFTLSGFSTVKREGITLTTNFTATVNADLKVGSLEETLTVTSEAPSVDVHNDVQGVMVSRALIESLPIQKGIESLASLVPGMKSSNASDVGGTTGQTYVTTSIHGGRPGDQRLLNDGLKSNNINGNGAGGGYTLYVNPESVQEMAVSVDNISPESELGGVLINVIPKDGGNIFSGSFVGNGANGSMQATNLTPAIAAAGLKNVAQTINVYDVNGAIGGPVVKDKLWFFNADRWWGNESTVPGIFYPYNPLAWIPNPNPNDPAITQNVQRANMARLTYQADSKNKFAVMYDNQHQFLPWVGLVPNGGATVNTGASTAGAGQVTVGGTGGVTTSPEAIDRTDQVPSYTIQLHWTSTVSSKFLLEAGSSFVDYAREQFPEPGVSLTTISALDLATNYRYRAAASYAAPDYRHTLLSHTFNDRFVASYITGSHSFKAGLNMSYGNQDSPVQVNNDMTYTLNAGVPVSVTLRATPLDQLVSFGPDLGLFAQDQWTMKHMTLIYGLRWTKFAAKADAASVPAGTFVPARSYPEVDCLPCWTDWTPRLGVVYDLRGDGKTAIKAGLNKYIPTYTVSLALLGNPQNTIVSSATRNWSDTNGNYVPDCNLLNPAANGECGPASLSTFGTSVVNTILDPNYLNGTDKRDSSNWTANVGIDQQLNGGFTVSAGYYRRWYENLLVTNNTLASPSDYSPYCVTAPTNSSLPAGVSGSQICGLYDISPAKFGQVLAVTGFASNYGSKTDIYDGVDFVVRARLAHNTFFNAGVGFGREAFNNCDVANKTTNPLASGSALGLVTRFCSYESNPFFQPNVKLNATYRLPWYDIQTSAVFQSLPGPMELATATFTNAQIAPSLGRNLGSCGFAATCNGTATVELVQPGTLFGDRLNETDVRAAKIFKFSKVSIEGDADLFNIFNRSAVTSVNSTYGPAWLTPTNMMGGRLLKLGVQVRF
jgi:hypothetical protein